MANKETLGRGLESLLGEAIGIESGEKIMRIKVTEIQPNEAQPRKQFAQAQMDSLVDSIREHGVLQPIIVRPTSKGYKIIAGERRWRAAKQLGIKLAFLVNLLNPEAAYSYPLYSPRMMLHSGF